MASTKVSEEVRERWNKEVYEKTKEIHVDNENDCRALALGYLIGCGLCPKDADEAIYNGELLY